MAKKLNVLFGEKYGDVSEPKTSWKRCGTIFIKDDAPADQVEAMMELVRAGKVSLKIDSMPVSKQYDGWLSIFEPKEWNKEAKADAEVAEGAAEAIDKAEEISLDEIPF